MNTSLKKTLSLCAVTAAWLGLACNTVPGDNLGNGNTGTPETPTNVPTGINIDGNWRHAAAGTLRETCFTITNNRVTRVDDGCNGNVLNLASTPSNQGSGSTVKVFVGFSASPSDSVNGGLYTYQLQVMSDGTLQGSGVLRNEPSGPILAGDVVWVRQ